MDDRDVEIFRSGRRYSRIVGREVDIAEKYAECDVSAGSVKPRPPHDNGRAIVKWE